MKRILTAAVLTGMFFFTGCMDTSEAETSEPETKQTAVSETEENEAADPVDFKKITLSENYCTAEDYLYEAEDAGEGVWLRSWISCTDDETPDYDTELLADETVKQQIMQMLGDCGALTWDGFSESDPDVSDGSSFHLEIILTDGTEISAYGSNAALENYSTFESCFKELITNGEIN